MKRKGGIRNSAEFIVRVREFWSCYLFIELVLYILLLVVEAPFHYKSFSDRNFFSQDAMVVIDAFSFAKVSSLRIIVL